MNKDPYSKLERVSSVETHEGKVYVTTQSSRPGMDRPKIQYVTPFPGLMITPEQGDIVQVYDLDDSSTVACLAHNAPNDYIAGDYDMPTLGQREIHLQMDGGTVLSFRSNTDGTYDLNLKASKKVNVNASGPVEINADSVTINATNSIDLGDSTSTKKLVQDVTTTKDADGHVTGISLTKTSKTQGE